MLENTMRLPAGLQKLAWELPHTFMGLEEEASDFDRAGVVILPVPYEATTSYGGGTANGPAAIVEASRYIELYDQELDTLPSDVGIATLPALELSGAGPEQAVAELREAYDAVLDAARGKLVITLGGEHSISSAPILAHAERLEREGRRLSVLQVDAHTDLRPEYEGSPWSHASIMARVADACDITAVGIRALTKEEADFARERESIRIFYADHIHEGTAWIDDVIATLGDDVYITFDVDGFDPSLVPATGTPEPGGLQWYPVMKLLRRVFAERHVHGVDVVELAPIPGYHAADFLVAKLVYKMIGYWQAGRRA
jgi:agmatinase